VGAAQLVSSWAEKDLGVLMDTKLNMTNNVLLWKISQMGSWITIEGVLPAGQGR